MPASQRSKAVSSRLAPRLGAWADFGGPLFLMRNVHTGHGVVPPAGREILLASYTVGVEAGAMSSFSEQMMFSPSPEHDAPVTCSLLWTSL